MKLFSGLAKSESIEETIESIEDRIDRLLDRRHEGVDTVRYRNEDWPIEKAIKDLRDRAKAWDRLNED